MRPAAMPANETPAPSSTLTLVRAPDTAAPARKTARAAAEGPSARRTALEKAAEAWAAEDPEDMWDNLPV